LWRCGSDARYRKNKKRRKKEKKEKIY